MNIVSEIIRNNVIAILETFLIKVLAISGNSKGEAGRNNNREVGQKNIG